MKKWLMAALAAAGLVAASAQAQTPAPPPPPGGGVVVSGPAVPVASGGYVGGTVGGGYGFSGPNTHLSGTGKFWSRGFFGSPRFSSAENLTRMPTLPVFMAAPWYQYWPYDGHFQTVAPMASGAFYPPPAYTGNPFLPARNVGYVPGTGVPNIPVK
jgi:hypothetical protein